jgi:hypothetical protein
MEVLTMLGAFALVPFRFPVSRLTLVLCLIPLLLLFWNATH